MVEFAANFPDVIKRRAATLIEKSLIRTAVAYSFLLLYLVHPTTIDPGVEGDLYLLQLLSGGR